MQKENIIVNKAACLLALEGEGGTKYRVRGKDNKANLINPPSSVLRTSSPSWGRGFTLIELLVVVLIIGILAAVAVPQYKEVVLKSKLTELSITINTYSKALDAWLLANGIPSQEVRFTGDGTHESLTYGSLDLDMSTETTGSIFACTKTGRWQVFCNPDNYEGICSMVINFYDLAGCPLGGIPEFGGARIWVAKDPSNNHWGLARIDYSPNNTVTKKICKWWRDNYGMSFARESAQTTCAAVAIE